MLREGHAFSARGDDRAVDVGGQFVNLMAKQTRLDDRALVTASACGCRPLMLVR